MVDVLIIILIISFHVFVSFVSLKLLDEKYKESNYPSNEIKDADLAMSLFPIINIVFLYYQLIEIEKEIKTEFNNEKIYFKRWF